MNNSRPLPNRYPAVKKNYRTCPYKLAQEIIEKNCGNVTVTDTFPSSNKMCALNKVIILPEAKRELDVMLSYGRRSPMNRLEQKYIGMGHVFESGDGHHIIIVKHFIEIHTTNRTPVGATNIGPNGESGALALLNYYREEYLEKEAEFNEDENGYLIDPFMKTAGPSEFVLEGHTHPDIGVFFSGPDTVSGKARAAMGPIAIFVCDPIRKQMLAAVGRNMEPAEVIVFSRSSTGSQAQKPASVLLLNQEKPEAQQIPEYQDSKDIETQIVSL